MAKSAETVVSWEQVRKAEFQLLHGNNPAEYAKDTHALRQSALCFSGGGIRSAAFCLGVLQALARRGMLTRFHYLSTVSGGGYIGSWLQVLLHQLGTGPAVEVLKQENPPQVEWLRQFTSYLTPSSGMLSTDTWAGITLYLRNLLLNWIVFLPFFMLLTFTAILERTTFALLSQPGFAGLDQLPALFVRILAAIAAAGLVGAIVGAALMLPSHRGEGRYASEHQIFLYSLYPSLIWAFLAPLAVAPWFQPITLGTPEQQLVVPFVFWCLAVAGFVIASLESLAKRFNGLVVVSALACAGLGAVASAAGLPLDYAAIAGAGLFALVALAFAAIDRRTETELGAYFYNLFPWVCAAAVGAVVLWGGELLGGLIRADHRAEMVAVLGPLWLVLCHALMTAIFVGLRREVRHAELDREWLARLSALKLRVGVLWAIFAAATLILSRVGLHEDRAWRPMLTALAAGPAAAWLGKQAMTRLEGLIGGKAMAVSWSLILNALGAVFIVAVAAVLGLIADETLGLLQTLIHLQLDQPGSPLRPSWQVMLAAQALLITVLLIIHHQDARRINVNRFSMHGVYRNRLIRAFLRGGRIGEPHDAFTNFDDADNPKLHELARIKDEPDRRLFPVIGMTLNLTGVGRLDWAERKGASFTATPLYCGAGYARRDRGAFVSSVDYAWRDGESKHHANKTGISLGTAMTISGAAVSPNWGYHSSPLTALLMTLFNVRLGAWLPNPVPANATDLDVAKPRNVFQALTAELLGNADDQKQAIYLSDGGHFDNLGLYEMLRRRCAVILVIDAGGDPDCKLFDLGTALRRAEIDLQVRVDWTGWLGSRTKRSADTKGLGFGRIAYPEGGEGVLVYLKPDYGQDLPLAIRAYGEEHPTFPHETTLDQWFTESQFESYRALGEYQATRLLDRAGPALTAALDPLVPWDAGGAALKAALAA